MKKMKNLKMWLNVERNAAYIALKIQDCWLLSLFCYKTNVYKIKTRLRSQKFDVNSDILLLVTNSLCWWQIFVSKIYKQHRCPKRTYIDTENINVVTNIDTVTAPFYVSYVIFYENFLIKNLYCLSKKVPW